MARKTAPIPPEPIVASITKCPKCEPTGPPAASAPCDESWGKSRPQIEEPVVRAAPPESLPTPRRSGLITVSGPSNDAGLGKAPAECPAPPGTDDPLVVGC